MRSVCVRSLSQTNGPFGEYKLHCTSGNLVSISPQLIHCINKRNKEQEFVEFEKLNTIINLPSVCYVTKREASQLTNIRGTQRQFLENICSKDDLTSRIFGTFVVKFLACLPLLGFSNI